MPKELYSDDIPDIPDSPVKFIRHKRVRKTPYLRKAYVTYKHIDGFKWVDIFMEIERKKDGCYTVPWNGPHMVVI